MNVQLDIKTQKISKYFLTSAGITWTAIPNNQKIFFGTDLVSGNGVYVNTGGIEYIYTTTNGTTWTQTKLPSLAFSVRFINGNHPSPKLLLESHTNYLMENQWQLILICH